MERFGTEINCGEQIRAAGLGLARRDRGGGEEGGSSGEVNEGEEVGRF